MANDTIRRYKVSLLIETEDEEEKKFAKHQQEVCIQPNHITKKYQAISQTCLSVWLSL